MVCESAIEELGNHYLWQMKFFTLDLSHYLPLCRPHATDQKSAPFTITTLHLLWKKLARLASGCAIQQVPMSMGFVRGCAIHPTSTLFVPGCTPKSRWISTNLSHKHSIHLWLCTQERTNKHRLIPHTPYSSHKHTIHPWRCISVQFIPANQVEGALWGNNI